LNFELEFELASNRQPTEWTLHNATAPSITFQTCLSFDVVLCDDG